MKILLAVVGGLLLLIFPFIVMKKSKVTKEENTIIAVFPIELDIDLSIITNNVFVNSTNIYGKTNINVFII